MTVDKMTMTYIGGPTTLMEVAGLRLLTDPTFDPAGGDYQTGPVILHKCEGPARSPDEIGHIDCVLLSHDHHFDNLDHSGRKLLANADRVITTPLAAAHLGGNAVGLGPWESTDIPAPGGRTVRVTGTPARHGPADMDRGPVTGFILAPSTHAPGVVYISGDTVLYEGVIEISRRFDVRIAILFLGAARVAAVGPAHLTLTAEEGVEAARAFHNARIVPLHFEGWAHFSESREDVARAFEKAGLTERLCWPERGNALTLAL